MQRFFLAVLLMLGFAGCANVHSATNDTPMSKPSGMDGGGGGY